MTEVWNLWKTKPPPICTTKTILHHKDINNLKNQLFDIIQTLQSIEYLHKEAALLSRYLYRNRRTFRHDKGTHNLVKMHQCLKRYLKLNFKETVSTFKQTFPAKVEASMSHAYLPTRQMLKWVLLRLQAFSQIFNRLIELSKKAGLYLYGKISLGWASYMSLLVFCMIARILTASKFILIKSIEWYDSLYKYQRFLESTAEFLPNYKFPVELKTWLGEIDVSIPKSKTNIDKVFEIIDLVREEEEKEEDEDDELSDKDDSVKVLVEKFVKPVFESEVEIIDSDIEEIEVEEPKKLKRSKTEIQDVGIPIDVEEDTEVPYKKFKKGKRKKFRKRDH